MIVDMEANTQLSAIFTVIKRQKAQHFIVYISHFYFKVPKTIRLNAWLYFIMKIHRKRKLITRYIESLV